MTGLRNPCAQIDGSPKGLMKQVVVRDEHGRPRFRSGITGIVVTGGVVRPGDPVDIGLPVGPHQDLDIL